MFELETTATGKEAEICQIAAVSMNPNDPVWMRYILPDSYINPYASQASGLTIATMDGKRRLLKDGIPVDAVLSEEAMSDFLVFLKTQAATAFKTIVIAHNAARFDVPVRLTACKSMVLQLMSLKNTGLVLLTAHLY